MANRDSGGKFIKGHKHSEEVINKISECKKGKIPNNAWKKGCTPWNKSKKTIFICQECGKEFLRANREIKQGRTKFCSKECVYKGRKCTNTFGKLDKHPGYKNGLSLNKYPSEFNLSLKNKIKKRDNYTCQLCGITEEQHKLKYNRGSSINHIDFNKNNCNENNLNTLCTGCNSKINWDREKWTKYFTSLPY